MLVQLQVSPAAVFVQKQHDIICLNRQIWETVTINNAIGQISLLTRGFKSFMPYAVSRFSHVAYTSHGENVMRDGGKGKLAINGSTTC